MRRKHRKEIGVLLYFFVNQFNDKKHFTTKISSINSNKINLKVLFNRLSIKPLTLAMATLSVPICWPSQVSTDWLRLISNNQLVNHVTFSTVPGNYSLLRQTSPSKRHLISMINPMNEKDRNANNFISNTMLMYAQLPYLLRWWPVIPVLLIKNQCTAQRRGTAIARKTMSCGHDIRLLV